MYSFIPIIISLLFFSEYSMAQSNDIVINVLKKSDSPHLVKKGLNLILGDEDVPKDTAEGVRLLRVAAELDNFTAQYLLGEIYNFGKLSGFKIDYIEAAKWYRKASKHKEAYYVSNPRDVFALDQAKVKARKIRNQNEFLTRHASVQTRLGELYFHGLGVQKDYVKAANLFHKAANQSNSSAQLNLGIIYAQGNGVSKNYSEAKKWLLIAAKNGNSDAENILRDIDQRMLNSTISFGLAIAGAAVLYSVLNDSPSKGDGSLQSSQARHSEYIRCYNQAIDRIAECKVIPQFNCNPTGCPDDKIECDKGRSGSACELDSAGVYYINTFGLKPFYCDTKNRKNRDSDIDVVINNICLQK